MTGSETETSQAGRVHAALQRFCKHPASILVWFCLLSLIIKEQFPFSHYPMYSGWSNRTHYFYIADENGPAQAKSIFKVSVPRMKKNYGGDNGTLSDVLEKKRKETGDKDYQPTDADYAEAGRLLLANLRARVPEKRLEGQLKDSGRNRLFHSDGRPLLVRDIVESELTLVRVDIRREGREFTFKEKPIVTTGADNRIIGPEPET